MRVTLSEAERAEVVAAQHTSRNVRHWRRYQAVLLRAEGVPLATVAQTLAARRPACATGRGRGASGE